MSSSSTKRRAIPSKWDLAAQAYTEVIKYPAPDNKVFGYAWYKLGYVFWNKGELEQGAQRVQEDDRVRRRPRAAAGRGEARRLARAATSSRSTRSRAIPAQAYNFLHNHLGRPGGSNEKTFKMMDDLGNNYLDTGHYPEAIVLYKDLMTRDKGGRHCVYQAHITEATMAMKSGNKDVIVKELDNQVEGPQRVQDTAATRPSRSSSARTRPPALATETAMAWHLEAVGSRRRRGTGDQKTMALAADALQEGRRQLGTRRSSRSSSSRAS